MATNERCLKGPKKFAPYRHFKIAPGRIKPHIFKPPGRSFLKTVQYRPACGLGCELCYDRVPIVADQEGLCGHGPDKVGERLFHMIQVAVDVGVVKFYSRENRPRRHVVKKFWPLVEKCCVVFVSLHDKIRPGADIIIAIKIPQDPPHHETRIKACRCQYPGKQG